MAENASLLQETRENGGTPPSARVTKETLETDRRSDFLNVCNKDTRHEKTRGAE